MDDYRNAVELRTALNMMLGWRIVSATEALTEEWQLRHDSFLSHPTMVRLFLFTCFEFSDAIAMCEDCDTVVDMQWQCRAEFPITIMV